MATHDKIPGHLPQGGSDVSNSTRENREKFMRAIARTAQEKMKSGDAGTFPSRFFQAMTRAMHKHNVVAVKLGTNDETMRNTIIRQEQEIVAMRREIQRLKDRETITPAALEKMRHHLKQAVIVTLPRNRRGQAYD